MIGKNLSHYKILEELGRGGMGIVYKAEDTKLDRTVAIKVLPSAALASEDDRARFYREAKAAAQLHHPHIASVFEIDEAVPEGSKDDDLRPFIAMEYIEGETLHDRIQKGPLKLEEAVRIASQIASGLKAAHAKDIVHRDIKGGNVMLTAEGDAKILDFGLAQTTASTKLTRMGSTLGTVAYMSPEQARGEEVDLRTDLWSLGAVLYEMVAGRSPFPGDYEQAVVYEILNQDPEPLTAVRTGVPMELERITSKCLIKDPARRYQHADELIADLSGVDISASGTTHLSTISSPGHSAMVSGGLTQNSPDSFVRKHAYLALVLSVFITAAVTWFVVTRDGDSTKGVDPAFFPYSVEVPLDDSHLIPRISPSGRHIVYWSRSQGRSRLLIHDLQENSSITVPLEINKQVQGAFSPDGSRYVFTQYGDGRLWTVPVEGGLPTVFGEVPESYRAIFPIWLANDKIAVTRENEIWTATVDNPEFQLLARLDSTLRFDHIGLPQRLPDPDKMLVSLTEASLVSGSAEHSAAWWVDLREGSFHIIQEGAGMSIYANSGHLIYNEGSNHALVVQPFDVTTLRPYGQKQTLGLGFLWTNFDFSESGVFTTFHEQSENWISSFTITWADEPQATMATSDERVNTIQFSDDGQYVGVWKIDSVSQAIKLVVLGRDGSPIDEIAGTNPPEVARIVDNGIAYVRLRNPVNNRYVILQRRLGNTRAADTLTTIERSSKYLDTSKDGLSVLLIKEDGQVVIRDIGTSEDRPLPSDPPDAKYSPDDSFISWIDETGGLRRLFASRIDGERSWVLADSVQSYDWQNENRIVYEVQFKDPTELRELTLSSSDGLAPESERILGTYDFLSGFDVDPVTGRVLLLLYEQGDAKLDIVVNWFSYLEEVAPTGRN